MGHLWSLCDDCVAQYAAESESGGFGRAPPRSESGPGRKTRAAKTPAGLGFRLGLDGGQEIAESQQGNRGNSSRSESQTVVRFYGYR